MVSMHITYQGKNKSMAVHDSSGTVIYTDAPVDVGGGGSSFSPTDLVATALATCVGTTMAMFADRHEIDLSGMQIHVTKEMFTGTPRRIGELKTTVTIPAGRVPADKRELLERVGHTCPVYRSMSPEVLMPMEFIYED